MANDSGTKDGLPFATSSGQPKQVTGGKPTDFTQPPHTGNEAGRGPIPRNFVDGSRRQGNTPPASMPTPVDPGARANVAQRPSTPAQRVCEKSIPQDGGGVGLPASLSGAPYRRGTGSVGSTAKPFKNMR